MFDLEPGQVQPGPNRPVSLIYLDLNTESRKTPDSDATGCHRPLRPLGAASVAWNEDVNVDINVGICERASHGQEAGLQRCAVCLRQATANGKGTKSERRDILISLSS